MIARGLKTNIVVNVAIILVLAMLLIDLVMTKTAQHEMLRAERARVLVLLHAIQARIVEKPPPHNAIPASLDGAFLNRLLTPPDNASVLILDRTGRKLFSALRQTDDEGQLAAFTREAIASGEISNNFIGKTWGVFWTQRKMMVLSAPLVQDGRIFAGVTIAASLEDVYRKLRRSQQILMVYILINAVILTLVGIHRISKIYIQPVRRLVRRAESYEDEAELFFAVRKEDSELSKLSNSLNRMLKRISDDKEKLRETVISLEKANLDLKQAQIEMIRAEKLASIGRLASGIAHEIGNPIGIVFGYLDLLKQDNLAPVDKREYIGRAENEIDRISKIIKQLLDLSRPAKKNPQVLSVHDLLLDMIQMLGTQPMMSHVELDSHFEAQADAVYADSDQLRQVFLNLVINAADAVAAGEKKSGRLSIRTLELAGTDPEALNCRETLKIMFSDNGPGIAPENLANIFDPFFTTKDPGKGTGLGLSVSFMIVEGVGGTITADSEPGCGTTITLLLPLSGRPK